MAEFSVESGEYLSRGGAGVRGRKRPSFVSSAGSVTMVLSEQLVVEGRYR